MESFFVDTHCHLDLFKDIHKSPSSENELPIKTITVTNSPTFYEPNTKLFSKLNNIRVALGLHPELALKFYGKAKLFEELISTTKYIGEIGLDGSKEYNSTFELQIKTFKNLLNIINVSDNKILTIHSRNAVKETIDCLHSYLQNTNCRIILHWFSGSFAELEQAINYGYYFSINHKMVTTKKGKEIISRIPVSSILTETDAPFTFDDTISNRLTSLEFSVKSLAEIKKMNANEMHHLIYTNFKKLLNEPPIIKLPNNP